MPSARQPAAKPTIINATARTRSAIEGLQARLNSVEPESGQTPETEDDLERELQTYFQNRGARNELYSHVIESVVDRILAEWPGIRQDIVERLIERIANDLRRSSTP